MYRRLHRRAKNKPLTIQEIPRYLGALVRIMFRFIPTALSGSKSKSGSKSIVSTADSDFDFDVHPVLLFKRNAFMTIAINVIRKVKFGFPLNDTRRINRSNSEAISRIENAPLGQRMPFLDKRSPVPVQKW